jgi:heterodisulfide reductase subunit B
MRFALYLGCTVPVRAMNYELSSRLTAERLGIKLVDVDGFSCCGYPAKPLSQEAALLMAANNLALAEEKGLDICTLCSACTSTLVEANRRLQEDKDLRSRVGQKLEDTTGRRYAGTVTVRHYARILYEDFGPERLREIAAGALKDGKAADLSAIGLAVHYGCHFLKRTSTMGSMTRKTHTRSATWWKPQERASYGTRKRTRAAAEASWRSIRIRRWQSPRAS